MMQDPGYTGHMRHSSYNRTDQGYGHDVVPMETDPIHVKLGRVSHRSAMFFIKTAVALAVVAIILMGGAYAILTQGPISVKFMAQPIKAAIQRELGNVNVQINDAVVQKAEYGIGIVFRLKGIKLTDQQGVTVAQAPSAAVGLSGWGLLSGRLAPGSVDFIGPKLVLVHSEKDGIRLAFSQDTSSENSGQSFNSHGRETSISKRIGDTIAAAQAQQIDLVHTLHNIFKNSKQGNAASSYLSRFGVRDAEIIVNSEDEQTRFSIPRMEVNLDHSKEYSVISGRAKLASHDGPWNLLLRSELDKSDKITLWLKSDNLVPADVASKFPNIKSLRVLNIPINGLAKFQLSPDGNLLLAETNVKFGKGFIKFSKDERSALPIDHGEFQVRYDRLKDVIEVLPSSVYWGGSHALFSGLFQPGVDKNGVKYWQYLIQTSDAAIETREFKIPKRKIDIWQAKGYILPDQKRIHLGQLLIKAGESFFDFSGDIIDTKASPELHLKGKISPMEISLFKQLWPRFAAPGAREWIGERVTRGYITGGDVKISLAGGALNQLAEGKVDIDENAFSLNLGIKDLETYYVSSLPPMQAKQAYGRFRGRKFIMDVPEAHISLPSGKKVALSQGSFSIPDLRQEVQDGIISFKTKGDAKELMEFLDLDSLEYLKKAKFDPNNLAGQFDGGMNLKLPLRRDVEFKDMTLDGKVKLRQAAFPNMVKDMEIANGTITFGISHEAVNANGRVYINGVPAELSWLRLYEAAADKQPGVRVMMSLNSEKLEKLGVPAGHFINGDVLTNVTINSDKRGKQIVKVHANLTNTEFILGSLGWSKPPGKSANLEFDLLPNNDNSADIDNFRIIGEDLIIKGRMALGTDGKLKQFEFPNFNVNLVTNLHIQGAKDERNHWDIVVTGPAYDGRQFFKTMLSSNKLASRRSGSESDTSNATIRVKIDTLLGHHNTKLRNVKMFMQSRKGKLTVFDANGDLDNGRKVVSKLKYNERENRIIRAEAGNAGYVFKMIGFYPNIDGGEAALEINLDAGKKGGESVQKGTLWAKNFVLLGDEIVKDVLSDNSVFGDEERGFIKRKRRVTREKLQFDQMKVPFAIGNGQFLLKPSFLYGPAMGVHLQGVVDFKRSKIQLGGTYLPVYALNELFKNIPIINLFVGNGLLGITFAIEGDLQSPEVVVNPASMVAPGILRGFFEFNKEIQKSPNGGFDVENGFVPN